MKLCSSNLSSFIHLSIRYLSFDSTKLSITFYFHFLLSRYSVDTLYWVGKDKQDTFESIWHLMETTLAFKNLFQCSDILDWLFNFNM